MPFKIIRNDITKVEADVIVNTANPEPVVGDGTDSAVYQAAGKESLLKERIKIGKLSPGQAAITPAFELSAKYIIHTVGPIWKDGKQEEDDILRSCYSNSLLLAEQVNAESIAFPLIATGVYGFPKNEALDIALSEIGKFLLTHDMEIILVVFDKESFQISEQLMGEIDQYIDEFGIEELYTDEYTERNDMYRRRRLQEQADYEINEEEISAAYAPIIAENDDSSLEDILDNAGETFQQCLLRLIRESGVDEVEIYKKANIDRKLFSSIRCKVNYKPKKKTAVALAIALELDMHTMMDTLHSNNMYQIFTYVKNKEAQLSSEPHEVSGMLLYAQTDESIQPNNTYQMSGNKISVRTLDLNCDFAQIATQLNQIVEEHFGIVV